MPPLARKDNNARSIDFPRNDQILRHMTSGGITRFLYGGNAFLYHISLAEYEELLDWLSGASDELWMIPSAGPSFGRLIDQAQILKRYKFPCVMALPCADPRDAAGLERGLREFARNPACRWCFISRKNRISARQDGRAGRSGADGRRRNVSWIKYAVVRNEPKEDPYLQAVVDRIDENRVVSGIGERPAIVHMRDWSLPGFTTGSGCIAPESSLELFQRVLRGHFDTAESFRQRFLPLENLRDNWGPARVLHAATELAGIANTGPIPPFITALNETAAKTN